MCYCLAGMANTRDDHFIVKGTNKILLKNRPQSLRSSSIFTKTPPPPLSFHASAEGTRSHAAPGALKVTLNRASFTLPRYRFSGPGPALRSSSVEAILHPRGPCAGECTSGSASLPKELARTRYEDSNALFARYFERVSQAALGCVPALSSCRANSLDPRVFPPCRGFADQTPAASRQQLGHRRRGIGEAPPAAKALAWFFSEASSRSSRPAPPRPLLLVAQEATR